MTEKEILEKISKALKGIVEARERIGVYQPIIDRTSTPPKTL